MANTTILMALLIVGIYVIYLELYCAIFSSVSCVSCTSCDHPLFPAYIRAVLCNIK